MTTDTQNEVATLGGGCFWCLEAVFQQLRGVLDVKSGYAGGHVDSPSYRQVCTGATGHAEVVQITFDPAIVSFHDLLEVFFTIHDPTTRDRQGNDVGPQYRSIILYHDDAQQQTARAVMDDVAARKVWDAPLVTELAPLTTFFPGEREHDDYFRRNAEQPYCQVIIAPKVAKFRHAFLDRLKA